MYLAVRLAALVDSGVAWVATDGNAASGITKFAADVRDLERLVDWSLMSSPMWNSTADDSDRQRRRMAELLVHRELPLRLVHDVTAYSDDYAEQARAALRGSPLAERVSVRPRWYYGLDGR